MRSYTVGIYSPGKAFVVYDIRRHVYYILALCQYGTFQMSNLADRSVAGYYTLHRIELAVTRIACGSLDFVKP